MRNKKALAKPRKAFYYYSGKNIKFNSAKRFSYDSSNKLFSNIMPGPSDYYLPSIFDRHLMAS